MKIIRSAADEAGIAGDEAVAKAFSKYDNAKAELMAAGMKYNKLAGKFNSTISKFPASVVADRKRKGSKAIFVYNLEGFGNDVAGQ